MRRRVAHLSGTALLALVLAPALGCRSKPLQELDGGTGVIVPSDAMLPPIWDGGVSDLGPATDAGGAIDAPWNVTFAGRRSFVVTAVAQTDGGAAGDISHTFTMTLDTDQRVAIIGKDGDTEVVPVEQQTAGVLHVVGTLRFGVFVPSACSGSLLYSALDFMIDPSGTSLSGSGQGTLTISDPVLGNLHRRIDGAHRRPRHRTADLDVVGRRRHRGSLDGVLGHLVGAAARAAGAAGAPVGDRGCHGRWEPRPAWRRS